MTSRRLRRLTLLKLGFVSPQECPECGQTVAAHEVAVVAPKLGANLRWHPACFTCSQCRELLVDLTYCVHDDALFCERHYAEQLKPRCSSCDEVRLANGRITTLQRIREIVVSD